MELSAPPRDSNWRLPSKSIAISKRYLLTYPDRSKKHINREERDSLLLSGCAKQIGPQQYSYIGPVHTFHAMTELSKLSITTESECRRFLQGSFVIEERGGRKYSERLETPGGMTARLIKQGSVAA